MGVALRRASVNEAKHALGGVSRLLGAEGWGQWVVGAVDDGLRD